LYKRQATPTSIGTVNPDGSITGGSTGSSSTVPSVDPLKGVYQKDLQTGALTMLAPNQLDIGANAVEAISGDAQHLLTGGQTSRFLFTQPNQSVVSLPIIAIHLNGSASVGNDILLGDSGPNQLAAGAGDDIYFVNHLADHVLELAGAGRDTVISQLRDYQLPDNLEILRLDNDYSLANTVSFNGSGNALDNLLVGNAADNMLFGWDGNDVLVGYRGKNRLDGGNGFDTARYVDPNINPNSGIGIVNSSDPDSFVAQNLADCTISKIAGGIRVTAKNGMLDDSLYNIERIVFADQAYALSGDVQAAQAYRLYQAAFNRAPDKAGLGFWINQIEHGLTLEQAAQSFMQSSEFKNMYGADISHQALVEKFYQNVLHRSGDAEGQHFWSGLLDNHQATPAQVLAAFAESAENQAALVGVMDAGFSFIPFVG
jgi:Ca2+-binding RTX toxin-like protein